MDAPRETHPTTNVDIVRLMNSAFNRGEVEECGRYMHPGVRLDDFMNAPDHPTTVHGRDVVLRQLEQWFDVFDRFRGDIEEYVDGGDRVVCVTRYRGTGKESGLAIDQTVTDVHWFEDGLIVHSVLSYPDKETALRAPRPGTEG